MPSPFYVGFVLIVGVKPKKENWFKQAADKLLPLAFIFSLKVYILRRFSLLQRASLVKC